MAKSPEFAKYFHEGAIPLIHPDLIDFRSYDENNNAFKTRNYLPAKERASRVSKIHKSAHFIEGEKYNEKDPNKKPNFRPIEKKKIIQPPLKYTTTETKRKVAEGIANTGRYSLEPTNEKLRTNPRFRENHREKWMSHKNFQMGYKNKTIKPISNFSSDVSDPFMGGKEKVIAMTSRIHNKTKNISEVEFSSVISKDPFQYNKANLTSLRSYGGILVLKNTGIAGDISTFTKNRRSMNLSKSVPKLIEINQNKNDTIHEILADFGQFPNKSFKIKTQLKGTQNKRYKVEKELDDRDILEMIMNKKKSYHMSAYDVVDKPEIVVKNRHKVCKPGKTNGK